MGQTAAAHGANEHGEKCTYQVEAMKVGYRYGYCVFGSAPRYIGINDDPMKAERLAKDATIVEWWVQRRSQLTEYRYEEPHSRPVTP